MTQVILFNVTNGLIIGAFYVLMALGLSLILNLSNVINFAHGNFLALGGYLAFTLSPTLGYWGALLVSPLLTALIGLTVERLMIRRVYNRDPVYSLLLTFGFAFVMQDAARYIWGPNGLPLGLPGFLSQPISADLFFITWYRVFMVAVVIVTVLGLFAFLRYTRVGVRIRAGTLDLETVASLGVNISLLRTFNFAARLPAGRPQRGACRRTDRPQSQHGRRPVDAELHRHHRRRRRQPDRHAVRRAADRDGGGPDHRVFYPSASEAVIYAIMMMVLLASSARPDG